MSALFINALKYGMDLNNTKKLLSDLSTADASKLLKYCTLKLNIENRCTKALTNVYHSRNPEAAEEIPFSSVRRTMARRRREAVPNIPENIADLVASFTNPLVLQHYGRTFDGTFFHGAVNDNAGTLVAVVFVNEDVINLVTDHPNEVREIGLDSTFKVVPKIPRGFMQLFTVHVMFMNVVSIFLKTRLLPFFSRFSSMSE